MNQSTEQNLDTLAAESQEVGIGQFIETMMEEKGLNPDGYVEKEGHINLSYRNLIEFIEGSVSEKDQEAIRDMLVKIDFANGDIEHYLNFLIDGMLKHMGFE